MRKIAICLVLAFLFVGFANAQTKSMTGTVVSAEEGTWRYQIIGVKVGNKEYFVYTFSTLHPEPKIIGNVREVGRTAQFFYTKIENGNEVFPTKIIEVKKSNTSTKKTTSDTCKFCGTWKYRESQSNFYLKITEVGTSKFRLVPGYDGVRGQIAWQENEESGLLITNADGIYLKPVSGKLVGSFKSTNFHTTSGAERTYKITCQLKLNGKMAYIVTSEGFTERYEATKMK